MDQTGILHSAYFTGEVWQQGVQGGWHYVGGKWRGHEKCRKGHTCWEGGGADVLWGLWGSFVGAWTGNISESLKSVDILERFKAVIFQSGGSLCDAGWPAAPSHRYYTHSSFSSPWIRKIPHNTWLFFWHSLWPDSVKSKVDIFKRLMSTSVGWTEDQYRYLLDNHVVFYLASFCLPSVFILSSFCLHSVLLLFSFCLPSVLLLSSFCLPSVFILSSFCPPSVSFLSSFCLPFVFLL